MYDKSSHDELLNRIIARSDPEYLEFSEKLIPGIDLSHGVRFPELRMIAKELLKGDWLGFLLHEDGSTYEELILKAMVLGKAKCPFETKRALLTEFVPRIRNWAVCDCLCSSLAVAKTEREELFSFAKAYMLSDREFEIRFGAITLMDNFLDAEHIGEVISLYEGVTNREYYVMMGVAWALSTCYIKFPAETEAAFARGTLYKTLQNKSLQKIRESFRCTAEQKESLKKYIIK